MTVTLKTTLSVVVKTVLTDFGIATISALFLKFVTRITFLVQNFFNLSVS